MKNIVQIVNTATSESLILVDELGSGTDPIEGSSLALSILEYLRKKQIITIATTHYHELKEYALVTNGIENASCEFNLDTLSPTYKLLIGVPGKSNAFAISKKLGLKDEILEKAKTLINTETAKTEDLLKEIYDSKTFIEAEKENISKSSSQIEQVKNDLLKEKEILEASQKEYIQKAKQEAKEILLKAKQEANDIIKEMNLEKNNSKKLNELRNRLTKELSKTTKAEITPNILNPINETDIKPGLEVFIPSFNKNGIILNYPNQAKKVNVQIDSIKTSLPISALTSAKKIEENRQIISKRQSTFAPKKVNTEINVIGLNIEEANYLVDKFLDTAALSRLEFVRIVHGKGSGILGKGIQSFLKKHPHVKSFRYGTFGEGEMGVTVVELKK